MPVGEHPEHKQCLSALGSETDEPDRPRPSGIPVYIRCAGARAYLSVQVSKLLAGYGPRGKATAHARRCTRPTKLAHCCCCWRLSFCVCLSLGAAAGYPGTVPSSTSSKRVDDIGRPRRNSPGTWFSHPWSFSFSYEQSPEGTWKQKQKNKFFWFSSTMTGCKPTESPLTKKVKKRERGATVS